MVNESKIIVGREEWCQFPSLGLPLIKARVDSGARTSSLHAFNMQTYKKSGDQWISFDIHPIQSNRKVVIRCEAAVVDRRVVKSSSGNSERRYVIKVPVILGPNEWDIEVTLTNRDTMGFRMLLGREAMNGRMLVDPQSIFLQGEYDERDVQSTYKKNRRQASGLNIALLANDPTLYSNKRIVEAGQERGHDMQFIRIKHCYMKLDAGNPEVHYRGGRVLNHFDAVIPRIRPSMTFYGCALTRQFESMGVSVLNDSASIVRSRDKLHSLQLLLQNGVNIPTTGFANSPIDTDDLIEMIGKAPLVIKLLEGAQGKGVVLAETKKAAESVINAFKSLKANLLVQEFIKEANAKDLRCFVVDGKVVASMERQAAEGDFKANTHQGGTARIAKVSLQERKLAVKAAKIMGLKVAGVDIIRSNKGPLLLEVNSSPGLEGIESATGKDVASSMIIAVEKQLNWSFEKEDTFHVN